MHPTILSPTTTLLVRTKNGSQLMTLLIIQTPVFISPEYTQYWGILQKMRALSWHWNYLQRLSIWPKKVSCRSHYKIGSPKNLEKKSWKNPAILPVFVIIVFLTVLLLYTCNGVFQLSIWISLFPSGRDFFRIYNELDKHSAYLLTGAIWSVLTLFANRYPFGFSIYFAWTMI